MQKIKLEITGIAYSQTQSGSYVLTLLEVAGKRKLPIVIGGFEAQAIAVELEKMVPSRPLTHDLFKSFCKSFGVTVKEILIYKFHEGVFHSKLICEKDGQQTEIDSRTSDAIAIGVRFNAPIFTLSQILDEVGGVESSSDESFDFEEEDDADVSQAVEGNEWRNASSEDLSNQLAEAIENEDYELASKIRDEIKRRD
ncbi:MAG: bifunctional nuclease domain-containing protein [Flavobacteriales bacterium]